MTQTGGGISPHPPASRILVDNIKAQCNRPIVSCVDESSDSYENFWQISLSHLCCWALERDVTYYCRERFTGALNGADTASALPAIDRQEQLLPRNGVSNWRADLRAQAEDERTEVQRDAASVPKSRQPHRHASGGWLTDPRTSPPVSNVFCFPPLSTRG